MEALKGQLPTTMDAGMTSVLLDEALRKICPRTVMDLPTVACEADWTVPENVVALDVWTCS